MKLAALVAQEATQEFWKSHNATTIVNNDVETMVKKLLDIAAKGNNDVMIKLDQLPQYMQWHKCSNRRCNISIPDGEIARRAERYIDVLRQQGFGVDPCVESTDRGDVMHGYFFYWYHVQQSKTITISASV